MKLDMREHKRISKRISANLANYILYKRIIKKSIYFAYNEKKFANNLA